VFASKSVPINHNNPFEADQHHAYAEYIRVLHSQLRRVTYLPDLISAVVHIKVGLWGEEPAPLTFPVLLDADEDPPYPYECPVFAKVVKDALPNLTASSLQLLSPVSLTTPQLPTTGSQPGRSFPWHRPVSVPLTNLASMCRLSFSTAFACRHLIAHRAVYLLTLGVVDVHCVPQAVRGDSFLFNAHVKSMEPTSKWLYRGAAMVAQA
jgi:hypothetical protein